MSTTADSNGSPRDSLALLALSQGLVAPEHRTEAARALAQRLGAEDLILLVPDAASGQLRPAPGFVTALPVGPEWRAFLAEVGRAVAYQATLPVPPNGAPRPVLGLAADNGSLLVLLGGRPRLADVLPLRPLVAILAAALRGEDTARTAHTQTLLARQSAAEASALATSLDQARARLDHLARENSRLNHQAEDALHVRDQFLVIASHELRTPLTSAKVGAQLLRRLFDRGETGDPRATDLLARVEHSLDRLNALITNLLDVSRLRSEPLPLQLEALSLLDLAQALVAERRPYLNERHRLGILSREPPPPVRGDPARLQLVLGNLVDNAVTYSPDGGQITVRVETVEGGACLSVSDPGIGLPPGAVDTLFEPFGRAVNAQRRHLPGMGLGLFIARQIIQQHHGRIWLDSPGEGQGTTAHVWLPPAPEQAASFTG